MLFNHQFGYSMLLMSYAGYISEFECVVLPESARQSRSAVYTNRSPQLETGSGRVHNDSTLNVCRVNGTECHDFRFLGSKRTVISEVSLRNVAPLLPAPFSKKRYNISAYIIHTRIYICVCVCVCSEVFGLSRKKPW